MPRNPTAFWSPMSAAWSGRRSWSIPAKDRSRRKPYDSRAYEACLKDSIDEVVRQQVDAGVDIVSDGEFSKGRNWAFYIHDRLSGIDPRPLTAEEAKDPLTPAGGGHDRKRFRNSMRNTIAATGLGQRLGNRFVVNGPRSNIPVRSRSRATSTT